MLSIFSSNKKPNNLNIDSETGINNYVNKIKIDKNKNEKLSKYKSYMLKNYRNELCLKAIERDNYIVFKWALENNFRCGMIECKKAVELNSDIFLELAIKHFFSEILFNKFRQNYYRIKNNCDEYIRLLNQLKTIAENNLNNFKVENNKNKIVKCNKCIEIINSYILKYQNKIKELNEKI